MRDSVIERSTNDLTVRAPFSGVAGSLVHGLSYAVVAALTLLLAAVALIVLAGLVPIVTIVHALTGRQGVSTSREGWQSIAAA